MAMLNNQRVSQDSSPDGPFFFVTLKSQAERGDYGLQDAQKKPDMLLIFRSEASYFQSVTTTYKVVPQFVS